MPGLIFALVALFLLTSCSFTLAGDVTPPPQEDQLPASSNQAAPAGSDVFPLVLPNPANGQAVFQEKCAPCHGDTGEGDGPRAGELSAPPAALNSEAVARQATPAYWFNIVTAGNTEKFMPPFASLSDQQRWDVVAYAFSLSMTADNISNGTTLYRRQCARCHGEQGKGDGPDAARLSKPVTNLVDPAFMARTSANDMYRSMTTGIAPAMPAFGDQLSETERWALTDYLRQISFSTPEISHTLSLTSTQGISATATITPSNTTTGMLKSGTVTGKVTNGSGGALPQSLPVVLYGYDDTEPVITRTTTINADGSFIFPNVEMVLGRVFIATTQFDNTTYGSDVSVTPPDSTLLDLPITVFATTTDPSVISADRLHLFFEILDENTIRVVELYIMSNNSTTTLVPSGVGQPTIRFKLPLNSTNLQFQDSALGERYVETPDGFGDTAVVRPGSGSYQVLFAFEMPYDGSLELVQPVPLPVSAVVILVPEGNIHIRSDMLQDGGTRDVEGTTYHSYNGGSLNAGQELRLALSGGLSEPSLEASTRNDLLIGVGFFVLALAVLAAWVFLRARRKKALAAAQTPAGSLAENIDRAMDSLLALDDLYQAGEIPQAAYLQRREAFKSRLAELLKQSKG